MKVKLTLQAGIVASIALCLVYGGLAYLGATVSTKYGADISSDIVNSEYNKYAAWPAW